MAETPTAVYLSIPLDQISPSPHQARHVFDEEAIKGLAESMKQEGLIQPITVRKVGDSYELIAGERRWRSAKLLGWNSIDAIVRIDVSDQEAAIEGLIENLQRENLNPIEQAKGYKHLEEMNLTQEEISAKVGKSRPVIANMLALLEMPLEIQEIVSRETISETHARILRQISDKKSQIALAKQAEAEGLSVKELERRVRELLAVGRGMTHKKALSPTYQDPLATIWPSIIMNPEVAPINTWGVIYAPHQYVVVKGKPPVSILAWNFWLSANTSTPKATLKSWLLALAEALGDTHQEQTTANAVMDALTVTDPAELERLTEESKHLRLPKTPEEWSDLEAKAARGPGALYAWTFGESSLMAKKAASVTWQDMGESDPAAGCRTLIEGLQIMKDQSK